MRAGSFSDGSSLSWLASDARRLGFLGSGCRFLSHRVGSLRRTDSVAIEGIADIRRSLAARRSDANDPERSFMLDVLTLFVQVLA